MVSPNNIGAPAPVYARDRESTFDQVRQYLVADANAVESCELQERVYFHHLVGTAGNTVANTIADSKPGYKRTQFVYRPDCPPHADDLRHLSTAPGRTLYCGHYLVGMPEAAGLAVKYITFMRHPFERLISDHFWRYPGEPPAAIDGFMRLVDESDHLEFYIHYFGVLDHRANGHFNLAECSRVSNDRARDLALAKLRDKYQFIGIAEDLEESLFLLARKIGLKFLAPWWKMRGPKTPFRPGFFDLPLGVRRAIEKKMPFDLELYEQRREWLRLEFEKADFGVPFSDYRRGALGLDDVKRYSTTGTGTVRSSAASRAETGLAIAQELFQRGIVDAAFKQAAECADQLPADPRPSHLLGKIMLRVGKSEKATQYLMESLAKGEATNELRVDLARAYVALGQHQIAVQHIAAALASDPYDPRALKIAAELHVLLAKTAKHSVDRGIAVVMGAAGTVGAATVKRLSALGFECVALDIDGGALQKISHPGHKIRPVVADVSDRKSMRDAFSDLGTIDLLVNQAEIRRQTPFTELNEGSLQETLAVNLAGAMIALQEALPKMKQGSRVVMVGCMGADRPNGSIGIADYVASKGALAGLWSGSVAELATRGIMTHMVLTAPPGAQKQRQIANTGLPSQQPPWSLAVADAVAALSLRHEPFPFISGLTIDVR